MVRGSKFVIAALFLVPISGVFSSQVWVFQSQILYALLVVGAILGISYVKPEPILKALFVLAVLQGLLVVYQTLGLDPFFNSIKGSGDIPIGFSGSKNQSGLFFAVTLPIILVYAPIFLPLHLFALFMAKTTSALIGALCASILVTRKTLFVLPIILLLFFWKFDTFSKVAYMERFMVYKHSIVATAKGKLPMIVGDKRAIAHCNPMFGYGYGNFKRYSPYNQNLYLSKAHGTHRYFHAHNDYIEVFFEFGYFGLLALMSIFGNAIYRFIRTKKTKILIVVSACLLAQAVSALGIFTVHTATSGMLLIIFYGLFIGLTRRTT